MSIQAGYDRWAQVYDHDANPLIALETPVVPALVGDVAGCDVPCGGTCYLGCVGRAASRCFFS